MKKPFIQPLVIAIVGLLWVAAAKRCLAESAVDADPVVENNVTQDGKTENFSLHGQATYVLQYKNRFHSPYEGNKSMLSTGDHGKSYTLTITPFMGARLWEGAAVFYNRIARLLKKERRITLIRLFHLANMLDIVAAHTVNTAHWKTATPHDSHRDNLGWRNQHLH